MGKKGKGKGKKKDKKEKEGGNILSEVDKTFYELQITDLNRKLARLRSLTQELEEKNIELEKSFLKLDDDRGDIIAYLKRTLNDKTSENLELQERLTALQESKESDTKEFEEKIEELQTEYNNMREQLTSEIKLMTGKLNALEEFRMQRDELMQKFEQQEKNIEEQEIRHKRILYETEKKFILGKDAIKREMEQQLFKLASDFEEANELRIAATTQRVIRENITINNEINKLIASAERLEKENDDLKSKNKELRLNCDLYQLERNKALHDTGLQRGIIEQLSKEHARLMKILTEHEAAIDQNKQHEHALRESLNREEILKSKIKILEQNLHATRCHQHSLQTELNTNSQLTLELQGIIYEAVMVIKSALMIRSDTNLDEAARISKREDLLNNLLALMSQTKEDAMAVSSLETVSSISAAYKKGDLGFIPKVHLQKKPPPPSFHVDSQVGHSFEDFLKLQIETGSIKSELSVQAEEIYDYKEVEEKSEESIISTTESTIEEDEEDVSSDGTEKVKKDSKDIRPSEFIMSSEDFVEEIEYEEVEEEYLEEEDPTDI